MDLTPAKNFFDRNYSVGGTSGDGSTVDVTTVYRHIIEEFIRLNQVRTVLDVGCGDWRFSRRIPWDDYGITYLGLDVSPFIVARNTQEYGHDRRKFAVIGEPREILNHGRFDLIICKDAMQHMPNAIINEYLDVFSEAGRFSLLTNDAFPLINLNQDIDAGGWRALDLRIAPFSRRTAVIAEYVNYFGAEVPSWAPGPTFFTKHVHLLPGKA
jgi:SAM-dependent methyltransferase